MSGAGGRRLVLLCRATCTHGYQPQAGRFQGGEDAHLPGTLFAPDPRKLQQARVVHDHSSAQGRVGNQRTQVLRDDVAHVDVAIGYPGDRQKVMDGVAKLVKVGVGMYGGQCAEYGVLACLTDVTTMRASRIPFNNKTQ